MTYNADAAQEHANKAEVFLREAENVLRNEPNLVNRDEWETFCRAMTILVVNRPDKVDFWPAVPEKLIALESGVVVGFAPGNAPDVIG